MLGAKLTVLSSAILAHVNPATGDVNDHMWVHAIETGLIVGAAIFILYVVRWLRKRRSET